MKPQRHAEQVITQTDAIDDERRQELQALTQFMGRFLLLFLLEQS